jgi:hypothetical protein
MKVSAFLLAPPPQSTNRNYSLILDQDSFGGFSKKKDEFSLSFNLYIKYWIFKRFVIKEIISRIKQYKQCSHKISRLMRQAMYRVMF